MSPSGSPGRGWLSLRKVTPIARAWRSEASEQIALRFALEPVGQTPLEMRGIARNDNAVRDRTVAWMRPRRLRLMRDDMGDAAQHDFGIGREGNACGWRASRPAIQLRERSTKAKRLLAAGARRHGDGDRLALAGRA